MKELMCRGKIIDNKIWVYGYPVLCFTKKGEEFGIKDTICHVGDGKIDLEPIMVIPESVSRKTGAADTHMVNIYGGDIVRQTLEDTTDETIYTRELEIYYSDNEMGWKARELPYDDCLPDFSLTKKWLDRQELEVVGNIWDRKGDK